MFALFKFVFSRTNDVKKQRDTPPVPLPDYWNFRKKLYKFETIKGVGL